MAAKTPLAFLGLGAMGFGMATNLVKGGFQVTGFDIWGPTLDRFKEAGGATATSPAAAVAKHQYCVCMVATKEQAQDVLLDGEQAAITALPQGAVVLLCSTVPCGYVQALEKDFAARGRSDIFLIDCPVSGGIRRAANGTLTIMAGASDAALEKGRHLLQAMADPAKLYIVKGGIGAGSNMKMVHQVLAANQILSTNEAMGFAAHLDLDLPKTAAVITASEGASWMFEDRSPRVLHPEHKPIASAVNIILKDTGIITSEARRSDFAPHMASAAEQAYLVGFGKGYGPDDDGSLVRVYTEGKGKADPVKLAAQSEEEKTRLVVNLLRGIHLCSAAEMVAFSHHLGLDLDQVLELCVNAAGGSRILSREGQNLVDAFRNGTARSGWKSEEGQSTLAQITQELQAAVDEAQRLKMPLFLGSQALNLMRAQLRAAGEGASTLSVGSVVGRWAAA